jgi:hypothetical protein
VVEAIEEDEYFPPPRDLRDLLKGVAAAAAIGFGASGIDANPAAVDRTIPAARMLVPSVAPAN